MSTQASAAVGAPSLLIYTLWQAGDEGDIPWLVAAVDEYSVDANNGFPAEYAKLRERSDHRELVIRVPEKAVRSLFESPVVKAEVVKEER